MSDNQSNEAKQLQQGLQALKDLVKTTQDARHAITEPKPPANFAQLCNQWAMRDYWTVKEGLNLLCSCHPEKTYWDSGVGELWTIAQHCIGPSGSLNVINPEAKGIASNRARKYKIRPADLLRWAREKGIAIPPEVSQAVSGIDTTTPSQIATQSREDAKAKRLRLLRGFCDEVYERGARQGMSWARQRAPFPVTKAEFREVFYHVHGEALGAPKAQATFNDDLKDVGAVFAPGTKSNHSNALAQLFITPK